MVESRQGNGMVCVNYPLTRHGNGMVCVNPPLLVAKNAVLQRCPIRELHAAPQPVTTVNYEYTWALVRTGTSVGTRAVQEVVHSFGMSSAGLRRIDPVWPRSSRFAHLSATRLYGNLS
jgi:hypothetical protein